MTSVLAPSDHTGGIEQVSGRGDFALNDRYLREEGSIYLTGIQALVRMLMDRAKHDQRMGRVPATYVSGYEGSPLAGYDLEIFRRKSLLGPLGVVHQPGLNEEMAATAMVGTQLAGEVAGFRQPGVRGVTGIWYGKAPGLDRASDAIRHANLTGTSPEGGVVALVGDDPSAKSSSFPCSSELALADLQLPALYPADSQEVLDYGLHAVELSRASGLWSAMKVATNVADGASTAEVTPTWNAPDMSDLGDGLKAYSHKPHSRLIGAALAGLERSQQETRYSIAVEYLRRSGVNTISGATGRARYGMVAAGKTWLDLKQALATMGIDEDGLEQHGIRLLKLGAIWPIEPSIVKAFAEGLEEIVVVEDKRSFLESAIKEILYGTPNAPHVTGKRDLDGRRLFPEMGELDPDVVATGLARRLAGSDIESVTAFTGRQTQDPVRISLPVISRTPYFCSGCPHNSSTKVPEDTLVGGGIGCHAMVLVMPEKQTGKVTGISQMGGEGGHWIGMAPFVDTEHYLQNVGDGTFAHSGSLAVRASIAAGVDITYKLLFNSAVAMTGGQDAIGGVTVEEIANMMLLEGAKRVVITTENPTKTKRALRRLGGRAAGGDVQVRHRDDLIAAQEELAVVKGVTILIHDQECAAELRRKRKRDKAPTPVERVLINERVCEGCGDCGEKSNCMSVHPVDTEFGRKTQIHQSSCNLDFSCLKGDCPSFLSVVPGSAGRPKPAPVSDTDVLPDPEARFTDDEFSMRITGLGGTGVVTVAQILATAGFLDGFDVRALDQTGLAQKGGGVVSDVKLSRHRADRAAKVAKGECDLYLGCDPLVATDPIQLKAADPKRTVAVVTTAEVPTGQMVVDTAIAFPSPGSIRDAFAGRVDESFFVDANAVAKELFGDEQYANMLLVGAAYQLGGLPISATSIERAIELNGTKVETNVQAFRQGRRAVLPNDVDEATSQTVQDRSTTVPGLVNHAAAARILKLIGATGELADLLARRVPELVAYQNAAYAQSYADFVIRVRDAEEAAIPGSTEFTEAVAAHLFKVMAYKDEYEVARLSLDPALDAALEEQFGPGSRASYRLHPPMLRAMGMKDKISLGPWARPGFAALYRMRRLRATKLDPFGKAEVRRVERGLIGEYRAAVERALAKLDKDTLTNAVEIAELPDIVRGYEDIKLRNVAKFRARLSELESVQVRAAATAGGA